MRIFWPDQITNKELWKRMKQPRVDSDQELQVGMARPYTAKTNLTIWPGKP
jgi:hypothetical protein